MTLYTKVLSPLASKPGLTLEIRFDVTGESATESKIETTKAALQELGLSGDVDVREEVQ